MSARADIETHAESMMALFRRHAATFHLMPTRTEMMEALGCKSNELIAEVYAHLEMTGRISRTGSGHGFRLTLLETGQFLVPKKMTTFGNSNGVIRLAPSLQAQNARFLEMAAEVGLVFEDDPRAVRREVPWRASPPVRTSAGVAVYG